jgi:DNA polymerase/3'-5' exonuclease PolX
MKKQLESKDSKWPFAEAYAIALDILEQLKPHCDRIEIAGSIRRKKSEVGDIEIVAIPKPYSSGLFENGIASVVNKWEKVRGDMEYGKTKYTQRILPHGIKLDLFFATAENWGHILAIRTGSADYSHNVLAKNWVRSGFKSKEGFLTYKGEKIEIKEEKDLFRLIGVPFIEPEKRI